MLAQVTPRAVDAIGRGGGGQREPALDVDAKLEGAKLRGVLASNALFTEADLRGADLREAFE